MFDTVKKAAVATVIALSLVVAPGAFAATQDAHPKDSAQTSRMMQGKGQMGNGMDMMKSNMTGSGKTMGNGNMMPMMKMMGEMNRMMDNCNKMMERTMQNRTTNGSTPRKK